MDRRKPPRGLFVVRAVMALAVTNGVARAAPPTDAQIAEARGRFAEGRKLEDAGSWAEALAVFQRVAEVKTTPQVRFHIALCMEHVGLWTQALDGYQRAVAEAGSGAPDVVREANEHMAKLSASMPTVTLAAQGVAADDEVHLDRRRVLIDDPPVPIRADPGPHVAEVRRNGAVVARRYFALAPRATLRVELHVGEVASSSQEPAAPPPAPTASSPHLPPIVVPPRTGTVQRALGWSSLGLGAASAVLTGVFIGLRADAMSRLEAGCPGLTQCPRSVANIVAEGKRDAALVNVFGVVGTLAAAAGVVILVTAPSHPAPKAVEVRAGLGSVSMQGRF